LVEPEQQAHRHGERRDGAGEDHDDAAEEVGREEAADTGKPAAAGEV
jgi:hypothetical protein